MAKGDLGDTCSRGVCNTPAHHQHLLEPHRYYCHACALGINDACKELVVNVIRAEDDQGPQGHRILEVGKEVLNNHNFELAKALQENLDFPNTVPCEVISQDTKHAIVTLDMVKDSMGNSKKFCVRVMNLRDTN